MTAHVINVASLRATTELLQLLDMLKFLKENPDIIAEEEVETIEELITLRTLFLESEGLVHKESIKFNLESFYDIIDTYKTKDKDSGVD